VATNREILRIDGESVYRVPPLDVPALGQAAPDCIMQYSAVELFVARTKALNAGFSPHADDLASIATICRRLDGIQLAIAFAAARAAVLSVQAVAAGLRDRFALLTAGRRTALPRQRTPRATLGAQSAGDDAAIDPVAIADEVVRSLIPGKCLPYLTCNPF
jgi:predicted ATPase